MCSSSMTDRETQLQHLVEAERHVALGERHIADQERRVAELCRGGYDIASARSLLDLFRDMQVQHVAYRDILRGQLGQ